MPQAVLSAGDTKIYKADTSYWTGLAPVGLAALQEECVTLPKRLLKMKKSFLHSI